jgi:predicted CXXCH cytochrome family protein
MKKTLTILAVTLLAIIASLAVVSTASANAGPHGGYDLNTGACSQCHRLHTAMSNDGMLLKTPTQYELCISCHDGQGATNVQDGLGLNGPLNGGGFLQFATSPNAATPTQWGGLATVTSRHDVEGIPLGGGQHTTGVGIAWGGASSGQGIQGTLECTSCHNPHGSVNYRMLNDDNPGGTPLTTSSSSKWVNSPDVMLWNFTIVSTATQYVTDTGMWTIGVAQVPATNDDLHNYSSGNVANYTGGMRMFCSTCHKSYLTANSNARRLPSDDLNNPGIYFYGTQDANDGYGDVGRYRHTMSRTGSTSTKYPIRLAAVDTITTGRNQFTCLTCHRAHGTAATLGTYGTAAGPAGDTALMYYDGRGVCNACHMKTK